MKHDEEEERQYNDKKTIAHNEIGSTTNGTNMSIITTSSRLIMFLMGLLLLIAGLVVVVYCNNDDNIASRVTSHLQLFDPSQTVHPKIALPPTPPSSSTSRSLLDAVDHHHKSRRRLLSANKNTTTGSSSHGHRSKQRLLYIITSSSPTYYVEGPVTLEDGTIIRSTERDRLNDIVFPIILDGVESFIASNEYSIIDVYMITSYEFTKEMYQSITTQLQDYKSSHNFDVGFQVWDNAMPMDYSCRYVRDPTTGKKDSLRQCYASNHRLKDPSQATVLELGAQLARQHRYVIKDKFPYYDFFVVFEDDMRVTQTHISNHQSTMKQLNQFKQYVLKNGGTIGGGAIASATNSITQAISKKLQQLNNGEEEDESLEFMNDMIIQHVERLRPGLIRVEVLPQDVSKQRIQQELDPIPLSTTITYNNKTYSSLTSSSSRSSSMVGGIDAEPCCHMKHHLPTVNNNNTKPKGNELMIWETGILGMSVRQMPPSSPEESSLGWVALLPGPMSGRHLPGYKAIYYKGLVPLPPSSAGSGGGDNDQNPQGEASSTSIVKKNKDRYPREGGDPRYLAQSAGWMGSPKELMELHTKLCDGGFLPPYDESRRFQRDGLHRHNVEFWSGGIQMWCGFCNIQRIVSLDPNRFSKHLIYHTANNKQKKIPEERLVRVTDFFGQLHTLKEEAAIITAGAVAASGASGTST